jgi:hypothetical protein
LLDQRGDRATRDRFGKSSSTGVTQYVNDHGRARCARTLP